MNNTPTMIICVCAETPWRNIPHIMHNVHINKPYMQYKAHTCCSSVLFAKSETSLPTIDKIVMDLCCVVYYAPHICYICHYIVQHSYIHTYMYNICSHCALCSRGRSLQAISTFTHKPPVLILPCECV